ncbi:MAG: hypothetical protein ABI042_17470 [Verrucomicrobiota bacterium]
MKKLFIISICAAGLTACNTSTINRTPNTGGRGEYGFTYDLEGTPSPFRDTSYQPLTPQEMAAPVIVTVTNDRPRAAYQNGTDVGVIRPVAIPPINDPLPNPVILDAAGTVKPATPEAVPAPEVSIPAPAPVPLEEAVPVPANPTTAPAAPATNETPNP